jgi:bifunctional enzyme CysN/CysC
MTMNQETGREKMNIVIVGHVDHGKSTIIGRLLADTHTLPDGKLEQVRASCERNSKPFEYAFLIDALKDEQSQGITIDSARVFFKTAKRSYIIIDAPGHIEFLKNMVTGASRAEAALLVIDANEGIRENSRRHGYLLSMLGIRQVAVLINKMDLVGYRRETFEALRDEYAAFLSRLGLGDSVPYIPVSGFEGDNIAAALGHMPWYEGPPVVEILDRFRKEDLPVDKPLRMPVQDVYKFTNFGDHRRIVAGTIETGTLHIGDNLIFYPSGKKGRVKTIEAFGSPALTEVAAGLATGFTLEEQIYINRGEIAARIDEPRPEVSSRLRVNLFWLGRDPLVRKKEYLLKVGTAKVPFKVADVHRVMDASTLSLLEQKDSVDRHDVAECTLELKKAIAFDRAGEIAGTGRFVIVDRYEIAGGGTIQSAVEDRQTWVREKVFVRDLKWEQSMISAEERAEKYNQKSTLILITGPKDSGKKPIAKRLEARLFADGKIVYFIGIGNVLYGLDADIKGRNGQREEHLRRLAELAHLMLDAGVILIVTAIDLTQDDLELVKTTIHADRIETVWVGDLVTTDIACDLRIDAGLPVEEAVDRIKGRLQEQGIIFKPW